MVSQSDPTPRKTNTTKSRQLEQQQHRIINQENENVSVLEEASISSPTSVGGNDSQETTAGASTLPDSQAGPVVVSPLELPNIANSSPPPPPRTTGDDGETSTEDAEGTRGDDYSQGVSTPPSTSQPPPALIRSRRFKGYLTILLASIINYNAAGSSEDPIDKTAVPAQPDQAKYAMSVSLLSAIVTGVVVVIHLDRYSPLESKLWRPAFSPNSKFESVLIVLLTIWWSIAAIVQTSVRGIAGDGKEQYNLYYSIWACWWTCIWVAERKLVDMGYPTFRTFVTSWPHRSPGWIAIFITDFFTLWWYVDAFNNTKRNSERVPKQLVGFYKDIDDSQYQWLIVVAAFTLLPSAIFILVEIVRAGGDETGPVPTTAEAATVRDGGNLATAFLGLSGSTSATATMALQRQKQLPFQQPEKKSGESILEGFCLLLLSISWTFSVIVATTPGGFASQVGNAYFCTWATTVFVLDTFLWFIHDWRKSVHKSLEEKEREYRRHQQEVLQATVQKIQQHYASTSPGEEEDDEEEDDADSEDDDDNNDPSEDDRDDKGYYYEGSGIASPSRFDKRSDEAIPPHGLQQQEHLDEHSEQYDDFVIEELRVKQRNKQAYFDNLKDIYE